MHPREQEELCHRLQGEQDDIHRDIAQWRTWWSQLKEMGRPRIGEMSSRIASIRDRLRSHFAHEEATGLLSRVADGDPDLRQRARSLLREHEELLTQLCDLVDKMNACGSDQLCWGGAGREFEEFLDRMARHEEEEARVLRAVTGSCEVSQ